MPPIHSKEAHKNVQRDLSKLLACFLFPLTTASEWLLRHSQTKAGMWNCNDGGRTRKRRGEDGIFISRVSLRVVHVRCERGDFAVTLSGQHECLLGCGLGSIANLICMHYKQTPKRLFGFNTL